MPLFARRYPQASRHSQLGLAGLVALTMVAACSGGESGEQSGEQPADDAATESPDANGGAADGGAPGQSLTIWMDSVFAPPMEEVVAGFQEEFGITVDVQPTEYGSIIGSYQQQVPAGSGPDLSDFNIDHLGPLSDARIAGALDLGDKLSNLDPRAVEGYTVDGEMLGLPLVLESTNVWRNPELVPEPVEDFEELAEVGRQLQEEGVEYPFVIDANSYVYSGMLTAFGGYVFARNEDGSYDVNDVGIDNEGGIQAMQFLADAVEEGWLKPGVDIDTVTDAWSQGQVGVHLSGPWMLSSYSETDVPFEIDPIPSGPDGPAVPFLSARGLVVNPLSDNSALAETFLTEYMAADEPMATFAEQTGKLSAWVPVQDQASEVTQQFQAAAEHAQPIPQDTEVAGYWAPMDDALELILQGQATPEGAARNAADQLRDSVSSVQD